MLPAEQTHYRRGLALGMTLAELFSVIVFILLLMAAFFLTVARAGQNEAEAERDKALVDLEIIRALVAESGSESFADADVWIAQTLRLREDTLRLRRELDSARRREELAMEQLSAVRRSANPNGSAGDSDDERDLGREVAELRVEHAAVSAERDAAQERADEAEARARENKATIENERRLSDAARQLMGRDGRLSPQEADSIMEGAARVGVLQDSLRAARRAVAERLGELRELRREYSGGTTIDSLRQELRRWNADVSLLNDLRENVASAERGRERAERDRDQAIERAEYREQEIERLKAGGGIDPPPCWSTDGRPEYIFRVTLTDVGFRMTTVATPQRWAQDPDARAVAGAVEEDSELTSTDFARVALPLYRLGASSTETWGARGCRYYVEVKDNTGTDKDVYKNRMQLLERYFFYRRVD